MNTQINIILRRYLSIYRDDIEVKRLLLKTIRIYPQPDNSHRHDTHDKVISFKNAELRSNPLGSLTALKTDGSLGIIRSYPHPPASNERQDYEQNINCR